MKIKMQAELTTEEVCEAVAAFVSAKMSQEVTANDVTIQDGGTALVSVGGVPDEQPKKSTVKSTKGTKTKKEENPNTSAVTEAEQALSGDAPEGATDSGVKDPETVDDKTETSQESAPPVAAPKRESIFQFAEKKSA
jgi:hypothetical protein